MAIIELLFDKNITGFKGTVSSLLVHPIKLAWSAISKGDYDKSGT